MGALGGGLRASVQPRPCRTYWRTGILSDALSDPVPASPVGGTDFGKHGHSSVNSSRQFSHLRVQFELAGLVSVALQNPLGPYPSVLVYAGPSRHCAGVPSLLSRATGLDLGIRKFASDCSLGSFPLLRNMEMKPLPQRCAGRRRSEDTGRLPRTSLTQVGHLEAITECHP